MIHSTKIVLVLVIVVVFAAAGALWWFAAHTYALAEELTTVVTTIANDQAIARDQQVLQELLVATADERAALAGLVLQGESGTITFLSEIDAFAAARGIELTTSALTVVKEARKPYDGLSVTYNIKGGESAVRDFIRALETLPYASEVLSVTLLQVANEQTGAVESNGTISLIISITNL